MTNTISRSQAKTWTLVAQLASVVFVLGAVALGVVGLPEPSTGATVDPANNAPFNSKPGANQNQSSKGSKKGSGSESGSSIAIDTTGLALRFALLDNAPRIIDNTVIEPEDDSSDPEGEPVNDGTIAKRVRYIGYIKDPNTKHAFIRIDGKQRIVSQGGTAKAGSDDFDDLTVERITPLHIIMSDGEKRAQIKLATRSGQSITMIDGGEVEIAPAAENGSLLTAEDEAKIAAMPARQQPGARRRLERERRGLSPENENRRPTPEPLAEFRGGFNNNRDRNRNTRNQD